MSDINSYACTMDKCDNCPGKQGLIDLFEKAEEGHARQHKV